MKSLLAPKKVLKFCGKLIEINRQYEANNNAELDNGVYHVEDDNIASSP
jgi:hypothetical protein